jgi:hypothetical protein
MCAYNRVQIRACTIVMQITARGRKTFVVHFLQYCTILFKPTLVKQSSDIIVDKTSGLFIWLQVLETVVLNFALASLLGLSLSECHIKLSACITSRFKFVRLSHLTKLLQLHYSLVSFVRLSR